MTKKPGQSPLEWLFLRLICLYQRILSPLMGNECRFYPTCSHYATDAVEKYGTVKGGTLAIKRILKCHPWSKGGIDPVP